MMSRRTAITAIISLLLLPLVIAINQTHQIAVTTNDTDITITDTHGNRITLNRSQANQTNTTDFRLPNACGDIEIDTVECADSVVNCGHVNITVACPTDTITCSDQTPALQQCLSLINTTIQPQQAIVATLPPQPTSPTTPEIPLWVIIVGAIAIIAFIYRDRLFPKRATDRGRQATDFESRRPSPDARGPTLEPRGWDGEEPPRFDDEARKKGLI